MEKGYKVYKTQDFIRKDEAGGLDFERSLNLIRELSEAAGRHSDHHILVDLRDTEAKMNFVELLTVALSFGDHEEFLDNKIAVLLPDDEERKKRAAYVKSTLRCAKGFDLDHFTDYEKAIDWLSRIEEVGS
jgi:hypothetical protein